MHVKRNGKKTSLRVEAEDKCLRHRLAGTEEGKSRQGRPNKRNTATKMVFEDVKQIGIKWKQGKTKAPN